jgi:hypothetical protein
LRQELEDAQAQLRIVGEERQMYQMQIDRVIILAGISNHCKRWRQVLHSKFNSQILKSTPKSASKKDNTIDNADCG